MAADTLREKLKKLVGELHEQAALYRRGQELWDERQALVYTQAARQLAAILAESEEPKPCTARECNSTEHDSMACPVRHQPYPTCACAFCAKAKLPLGHPYSTFVDGDERPCSAVVEVEVRDGEASLGHGLTVCGQPRSAHEPLPAPLPKPKL